MKIKAVSFDIGQTLIKYNTPLNWKSLYAPALRYVSENCRLDISEEHIRQASGILQKYNTRENPRETEVTSDIIFKEILDIWNQPIDILNAAKEAFYNFFQADAVCFDDTEETLKCLHVRGIKIGALTDVAYGMDNIFSLRDIYPIRNYFDFIFTSVDIGYRKPNKAGFAKLLQAFETHPTQMMYVGDEKKDIVGANSIGIISVLINRTDKPLNYGQRFTIRNLSDMCALL